MLIWVFLEAGTKGKLNERKYLLEKLVVWWSSRSNAPVKSNKGREKNVVDKC